MKRIGQKELARQLGVSQAAISGVLNNNPSIRVGKETRQRILDAIKDTSYQPNLLANAVFDRPTKTMGIIYQGGYFQLGKRKLAAVIQKIVSRGYLPLVYHLMDKMEGKEQCQLLRDIKVAGVVIINGSYPFMYEVLPTYLKGKVPVVAIDSPEEPEISQIFTDRRQGFRILTNHLVGKGYTKIAILANRVPRVAEDSPYTQAYGVLHGVQDSLSQAGLELAGVEYDGDTDSSGIAHDPYQSGAVALAKLLDKGCRPEAVICSSDAWAIGAIHECHQRGIRVPEDLAIVGFNNEIQGKYACSPLTTVNPPVDEMAEKAVETLIGPPGTKDVAKKRKKEASPEPELIKIDNDAPKCLPPQVLPCHLVIRKSCGRPEIKGGLGLG